MICLHTIISSETRLWCIALFLFLGHIPLLVFGQSDVPPAPTEYGKCYAKTVMPNRYEMVEEDVLVKKAYTKTVTIPAVYDEVEEEKLLKEAHTEYQLVPAVYEMVEEDVLVKEGASLVQEKYERLVQTQLTTAEHGRWVERKDPNCFSKKQSDCVVMLWEAVPAKYDTIVTKSLKESANAGSLAELPEYKKIKKIILKSPATIREVLVPAEYVKIKKKVLIEPARVEETLIPAEYKKQKREHLVGYGGEITWAEVLCPHKAVKHIVKQIQLALYNQGYTLAIDGILGPQTKNALQQYQDKKHLPSGNLNKETLLSLGLSF